jgi:hypothetical protein
MGNFDILIGRKIFQKKKIIEGQIIEGQIIEKKRIGKKKKRFLFKGISIESSIDIKKN